MSRPIRFSVVLAVAALIFAACETAEQTTPAPGEPGETPPPLVGDTPPPVTGDTPPPAGDTPAPGTPAPGETPTTGETPPPGGQQPPGDGILSRVQSRGSLICGINGGLAGFGFLDEAGQASGFDADFCRALAAAVLGDPEAVDFRPLSADDRGPALQTGEVDVLIRNTTWTVTRDAQWGLFAPTTFYDGQGMMIRADVQQELNAQSLEDLEGATICVQSGTTTELNLTDQFRARNIDFTAQVFGEIDETYTAYEQGICDAVTSDLSQLAAQKTRFANPDDHVLMDLVMSKEPLGPVAPFGDEQWFNVVKWMVFATIEAEELGITSENVAQLRDTSEDPVVRRLLGAEGELGSLLGLENDWVVTVIESVGNYEEIFNRNLGPETAINLERGPNRLWTDGGLLYAPPYR